MANKKVLTIETEQVPNQDMLVFHLSERVASTLIMFHDEDSFHSYEEDEGRILGIKLDEVLKKMVQALFDINGVTAVTINPYEVSIQKGRVFKWDKLKHRIELVLRKHLTGEVSFPDKPSQN